MAAENGFIVTDDAGTRRPVLTSTLVDTRLYARWRIRVFRANRISFADKVLYVGLVVVCIVFMAASAHLSMGTRGVLTVAGAVVGGALLGRLIVRRVNATRHVRRALGRALCPVCVYDLRDIPTVDDGLTTCPECGAAWRLHP